MPTLGPLYPRLCCKSPKLLGDIFPAIRRSDRRPPIRVASITLPGSPVSLSSGDEVPHIFTRKSRLQPGEFLITSAKRLLQHNRHIATNGGAAIFWSLLGHSGHRAARTRNGPVAIDPLRSYQHLLPSELCYIHVGKAASPDSLWTRCPNETAQGHYARQI
jgi:hypothetical protein